VIVATRATALLLAGLLAVYPLRMGDATPVLAALAAAGVVAVAAGLLRAAEWTVWVGAGLLGLGYVVNLALAGGEVDPFAPAVAVGLYLVVEARDVASSDSERASARLWDSLTVGFASALIVAVLLLAGTAVTASGPLAVAASALCGAVALSGLAAFAGRRAAADRD
jgi:hypothetical protein